MLIQNKTIYITDPFYLIRHNCAATDIYTDDWKFCNNGMRLDKLGFKNYLVDKFPTGHYIICDSDDNVLGNVNVLNAVCVVQEDELIQYNKYFIGWSKVNPKYAIKFNNFIGSINITNNNITGNGNIKFYSKYE